MFCLLAPLCSSECFRRSHGSKCPQPIWRLRNRAAQQLLISVLALEHHANRCIWLEVRLCCQSMAVLAQMLMHMRSLEGANTHLVAGPLCAES